METNPNKMNLQELRAELRAVKADQEETYEMQKRFMRERDEARAAGKQTRQAAYFTVCNLMQERADLLARVDRINLRMCGLGYPKEAGFVEILKEDDKG